MSASARRLEAALASRNELDAVATAIEEAGVKVDEANLEWLPNTPREVDGEEARKLYALYEALDDHDDVQSVFVDFELSDAAAAELE